MPPPASSLPPPSVATALLRRLAQTRSRILGTSPPSFPAPGTPGLGGVRTGAKVLRQRLVGPAMLRYYPPQLNLRSLPRLAPGIVDPRHGVEPVNLEAHAGAASALSHPPASSGRGNASAANDAASSSSASVKMVPRRLVDPKEVQRLRDVHRRKAMGKGPPKKGQGRRAALKGGKRK